MKRLRKIRKFFSRLTKRRRRITNKHDNILGDGVARGHLTLKRDELHSVVENLRALNIAAKAQPDVPQEQPASVPLGGQGYVKPIPPQIKLEDLYEKALEYLKGTEDEAPNCATGSFWMLEAANRGHLEAQYRMGVLFSAGVGVEKNLRESFTWMEKAAKRGCVGAQHSLGDMYRKGEGVIANDPESAYWYQQAADRGDPQAQYNIAVAFEEGRGVSQDYESARKYYELSSAQGVLDAKHNLAVMHLLEKGVEPSLEIAMRLLREASLAGFSPSTSMLDKIQKLSKYEERDEDEEYDDDDDDDLDSDDEDAAGVVHNDSTILRLQPERSKVKLFSASTKSDHFARAYEQRLIHLLKCKNVEFDLVDLDLKPKERAAEVLAVSGTAVLPQLHINGKYLGNFETLQELEDSGKLDLIFEKEGISVKRHSHTVTPTKRMSLYGDRVKSGALTAYASARAIHLEWTEAKPSQAQQFNSSWLLTMDGNPVFVGSATDYSVDVEDHETHFFALYRVPNERRSSVDHRMSTGSNGSSEDGWKRFGELSMRCVQ